MDTQDEAAIRGIVDQFAASWNRHDPEALAALFADDADFVNVIGLWWRGRAEIAERMRGNHATIFRESRLTPDQTRVRFLRPDVALVHTTWELAGQRTRDGRAVPPRTGIATFVLAKRDGTWSISAFHNTDVVPPPGPPSR